MRIYIGVPAYGPIEPAFVQSLVAFVSLLHIAGHEAELDLVSNCSLIAKARSEIAVRFMDSGFTKLLFLDADIGFKPEDAYRLCERTEDVIGGAYTAKTAEYTRYSCVPLRRTEAGWELEAIGTGFLKIERSALVLLHDRVPHVNGRPHYFNCGVIDGEYVGEDFQFCRDWLSVGGKIHLFQCELTHFGRYGYGADLADWLEAVTCESKPSH